MTRGLGSRTSATVCLVTHGERIVATTGRARPDVDDAIVAQVAEAALAGVDLVQVREVERGGADLCRLVGRCVAAARGTPTRVLVNDRLDVALAARADGVHLRGDSCAASRVRAIVPPGFLLGRSVHHARDVDVLERDALDFLVFGTVFSSASKPPGHPVKGTGMLANVVRAAAGLPVLAIGGVSIEHVPDIARAGAAGVAAIGLFLPGEAGAGATMSETVARLRAAFGVPAGAQ